MFNVKKIAAAFAIGALGIAGATALIAPVEADAQCPAGGGTVNAQKPTFNDSSSKDVYADTITIPASSCVHYLINGKRVNAGTHRVADYTEYAVNSTSNGWTVATATVMAEGNDGYYVTGYYWWEQGFIGAYTGNGGTITTPQKATVQATAPTFHDDTDCTNLTCMSGDTITIPTSEGISYTISGNKKEAVVTAGTYKVEDFANYTHVSLGNGHGMMKASVTVMASSADTQRYVVSGVNKWTQEFGGNLTYIPPNPPVAHPTPTTSPTATTPTPEPTATATTPAPKPTATTPAKKKVSFVAPTFNQADKTYTIPNVEGVQYSIDSKVIDPGTYPVTTWDAQGKAIISVKASLKNGYVSTDGYVPRTWSAGYSNTVQAQAPTFKPTGKKVNDTFTIPSTSGVDYYANGTKVAAGTHRVADYADYIVTSTFGSIKVSSATLVVEARAQQGYQVSGYYRWTQQFVSSDNGTVIINPIGGQTNLVQVTPKAPTYKAGWNFWFIKTPAKYTIPSVTGIDYYVNGHITKAGTYHIPAGQTVKIEAKPQAGYTFPYNTVTTNQWTYWSS